MVGQVLMWFPPMKCILRVAELSFIRMIRQKKGRWFETRGP